MKRLPSWNALHEAAEKRILIIDGAMGTMIQRHKLRGGRLSRGALQGLEA